jgi:H+/Cl- antiporter ClcA
MFLQISKFITVSSAGMSGFLGGQIAPLLFVGSGFGALFHRLISIFAPFVLDGHNINAFGIICGAALVGCNFENIFFPTVLVAEMTRSMEPTLGVMLTTAIATLVVKM